MKLFTNALHQKLSARKLPAFPPTLKKACVESLTLAAEWLTRTQIRDSWPAWDANKGRYPYHVRIDPDKRAKSPQVWSTCWKTARAAQGMYSAYLATGDKRYLESANLATDYVSTLQFFEPGYEPFHGLFREDSPQGPHFALRDGMEALQGFINRYMVTGEDRFLHRSLIGTDWILNHFQDGRFPWGIAFPFDASKKPTPAKSFLFHAAALVFAQMWAITGNKAYLTRGAARCMDEIIAHNILDNGALGQKNSNEKSHHVATTPYGNIVSNDDGVGVAMLATYSATGKKKYLDAAVGMADFWVDADMEPTALAAYSSIALFLADMARLTGDKKYLPRIEEFTAKTLALQWTKKSDPMLYGAYIGEDMATWYDTKSKATDWVDLRITSYSLIALAKVAASKASQWGCAYSCFGW